jgi:MFS family permease
VRFILAKLGLGSLRNDPAVRAISWQTLISRIGNGLFMTIEVIYFSHVVGFTPAQIAIAIGAGGAASLLMSVPSGVFADRIGAKRAMFVGHMAEAFILLGMLFVTDLWMLIAINVLISIAGTTGHNASSVIISNMGSTEERVHIRAAQRAMANMGIGFGTVIAGFALWLDTTLAYQSVIVLDTLMFIWAATYIFRLPPSPATLKKGEPISFIALKDWRFLAATLLNGIVSLHFVVQGVALPLWILHATKVPTWWVSVLFVINTVLVTILQIRFSKGGTDLISSVKKFRIGTAYLLSCCVVYSLAGHIETWMAISVLVIGMVVHTIGELYTAAGSWSIGFELAVEKHMGQYQGVYSLGWGLGGTFGPAYVTTCVLGFGIYGWAFMGAVFLISGIAMHSLVNAHPNARTSEVNS